MHRNTPTINGNHPEIQNSPISMATAHVPAPVHINVDLKEARARAPQ